MKPRQDAIEIHKAKGSPALRRPSRLATIQRELASGDGSSEQRPVMASGGRSRPSGPLETNRSTGPSGELQRPRFAKPAPPIGQILTGEIRLGESLSQTLPSKPPDPVSRRGIGVGPPGRPFTRIFAPFLWAENPNPPPARQLL